MKPTPGGWSRALFGDPGWVAEVAQSAYGHKARKLTWLYYVGSSPPPAIDWRRPRGSHQIGRFDRIKPTLSGKAASASPVPFRDLLLSIARSARNEA
jgi:hypothetical protein